MEQGCNYSPNFLGGSKLGGIGQKIVLEVITFPAHLLYLVMILFRILVKI
jgi:hypothetical protein